MPELPEAETIARDLRRHIVGSTITGVRVTHADVLAPGVSPESLDRALRGRRIEDVGRRAKNLVLTFDDGTRLVVNLGMTGRLVVGSSPRAGELRHVAVRFDLHTDAPLLYDDIRRFGRIELHSAESWAERENTFGVEPLSDRFTAEHLRSLVRASRTPIRNFLLDQKRIAGIGNIYANEALFRAGVHPARPANTLSADEAARLRDAIRDVLSEAIEARGTTFSDYRDARGETGGFQFRLRVYGREDEPCPVCGTAIQRIVPSNRSAFFCPHCQR